MHIETPCKNLHDNYKPRDIVQGQKTHVRNAA